MHHNLAPTDFLISELHPQDTMKLKNMIIIAAYGGISSAASAAVTVEVPNSTSSPNLESYMNVFFLNNNGDASTAQGGFAFGTGWGVADAVAIPNETTFTTTFIPNSVGDVSEYWYQNTSGAAADPAAPGGPGQLGNKFMEANTYVSDDSLVGEEVTFVGNVSSFSLTNAHIFEVFIKDLAPDYSSSNEASAVISETGSFSINLATDPSAGRHIQYGFRMKGENVWSTDVAPFGSVVVDQAAVPEPSSLLLGLLGMAFFARRRR